MVLKIYAIPMSNSAKRVAVVLYEKKIPHEFINVDMTNQEHKSAAYLDKQPFGQVPYIDDDGFILYESRAICRYLEAKYPNQGPKLAPSFGEGEGEDSIKATALFEQAASIEISNFDPYAGKAFFEGLFKPFFLKQPKDEVKYEEAIKTLSDKLDGYERVLAKQKYLAGNEITMVDLFHLPFGSMLVQGGSDIMTSKGPNVARWWKDVVSRESWQVVKGDIPTGTVTFD
ncbi:hypothetical protein VKT23_013783 [Stygiomarasmius scandens]|uniref:glutathione transferase n=1 Tax=Marasmiellus scandens TaxID=2682957 RepID=A0ABR1J767_9AGAR